MTDAKVIAAAYEDSLKKLYAVFAGSITAAGGDDDRIREAERAFRAGISNAHAIRERALAIVGQPSRALG